MNMKTWDDLTQEQCEFLELFQALPKSERDKFFRKIFMARNRAPHQNSATASENPHGKQAR